MPMTQTNTLSDCGSPSECRSRMKALGCCVIVPSYDNAGTLGRVLQEVLDYCGDVIAVNDGSRDDTASVLAGFGTKIRVLTHPFNYGKGVALVNGLQYARQEGFRYAISIDSDGQHFPSDLPLFVAAIEEEPDSLLVGARNLQAEGMPGKNTFANKFSNFWYKLETGIKLTDTQSGYRLYPLGKIDLSSSHFTGGYEFELEILVFSAWKGIKVKNIPVHVYYPPAEERVSHFRPLRDFTKISILNTILVLYCFFWRWPVNFFRKLSWASVKAFVDRNIIHSRESNARIASAIGFGVFMGVMPIWGYQMVCAFALAHLLRLNKVITIVASNISIPPCIPFIVFGSYWTGCKLLGQPVLVAFKDISLESVGGMLVQYLVGSLVFGLVLAVAVWLISMLALTLFRSNPAENPEAAPKSCLPPKLD